MMERLFRYILTILIFTNVVWAAFRSEAQKQDAIRYFEDILAERHYIPTSLMGVAGILLLLFFYPFSYYRCQVYGDQSMLAEKIKRYQKDLKELEPTIAGLEEKLSQNKEECRQMIKAVEESAEEEKKKVDDLLAKLDDIRKAVLAHQKTGKQIMEVEDALKCVKVVNTPMKSKFPAPNRTPNPKKTPKLNKSPKSKEIE